MVHWPLVYAEDTQDPLSWESSVLKYLTGFNLEENLAFLLKERLNSYLLRVASVCLVCGKCRVGQVTKCL